MFRIRNKLKTSFLFSALDAREIEVVVDAMEEKHFKAGDAIITQGDEGDNLYVIEEGKLNCSRRFVPLFSLSLGKKRRTQVFERISTR